MKKFIFILILLGLTAAAVTVEEDYEEDFQDLVSSESEVDLNVDPSTHGLIISSEVKKTVKTMLKQMPCGWPEKGIPPLAPYRKDELTIATKKSFLRTVTKLLRLQIDGLDNLKMKKLDVSYMYKKVKFNLIFKKIQATSLFNTDTLVDLMKELGLTIRYEGKGAIDLTLSNLAIKGSFKYKAPLIGGSVKIYKFKAAVTLGDCKSNISGLFPKEKLNRWFNDQIEESILSAINDNQEAVSAQIEETLVPTINESLKGKNVWDLIAMKPKPGVCIPPPNPWA